VHYREPFLRERYRFADEVIQQMGLEIYDYAPMGVAMADGPDVETGRMRFDFVKYYQWGPQGTIALSLGTEEPVEGEPFLCGVKDCLARPTGGFNWPWEAVWIGTKGCDTDLIKGPVPMVMDVRRAPNGPWTLYPLRDWSDAEVFDFLEPLGLIDEDRYEQNAEGVWGHKRDKSKNADYYPVCWNCVNRHAGHVVHCPRLKASITNVSESAPYVDLVFPDLGFKPTWEGASER